jgi:hypothetical protein
MRRPFIANTWKGHKTIEEAGWLIGGSSSRASDFLEIIKRGPVAREEQ